MAAQGRGLRGKPGEIYYRGFRKGRKIILSNGVDVQKQSRCYECPLRAACEMVCDERVASDPDIRAAFEHWMAACLGPRAMLEWLGHKNSSEFAAIVAHGPWDGINDSAAILSERIAAISAGSGGTLASVIGGLHRSTSLAR